MTSITTAGRAPPSCRLKLVGVGLASQAGKVAAYQELNRLVQAVAKRKTGPEQERPDQRHQDGPPASRREAHAEELGQAVPVVGIVVGAGVNAKTTNGVAEAAGNLYRERSLCEKYGMPEPTARAPATTVDEDSVDVADVREAEILVDGRESA